MEKIATKHFPATFADSLGWPDTVRASRDFFVTNLNYFAVIHRWQFDSVIWIEPCIGAHRGKELEFIRVGVTYLTGSVAVDNYMRLKAKDSLWTLLAETRFWSGGPEVWEGILKNSYWMFNRYNRTVHWVGYLRLEAFSTANTPQNLSQWQFAIGLLGTARARELLATGPNANVSAVTVNYVWFRGARFAAIISRRDGHQYWYQAIAGEHLKDRIVYRKLWPEPRLVDVKTYEHYEHLRRADSLWVLIDSSDWRRNEQNLQQMFDRAASFYGPDSSEVYRFPLK